MVHLQLDNVSTKDIMNSGKTNLISNSVLKAEITIIIVIAKIVKIKCLVKKK